MVSLTRAPHRAIGAGPFTLSTGLPGLHTLPNLAAEESPRVR
jgi:hypothetical protein